MFIRRSRNTIVRVSATGALALGALTLAGCADASQDEGTEVEDITEADAVEDESPDDETAGDGEAEAGDVVEPYNGRYDADFLGDYDGYLGETVTITAEVEQLVSENAFTVVDPDDASVEELLIVHDGADAESLEEGAVVDVTGEVEEGFDVMTVEDNLSIDLDDEEYDDWADQRYIRADLVEVAVED